ncbi:hypothetical protein [Lentzea sp. NPDC004782]|uniref:hypothetical protein n=1 Tax=Lentzea sp. NPDC004782 TaxID=3154458 RepID=UPI0033A4B9CB
MSKLERRYRRLLRVLPQWYRQDREEEMAAIFLAGRTDEHGRPGWGETGAVLGLAVRTHLAAGAALTGVPGKVMWRGEIVRALGMLGLLLGIFYAGASIANAVQSGVEYSGSTVTWLRALDLAPVVAFLALLNGWRTPAKTAAAVAVVPGMINLWPQHVWVWAVFQVPSLVTFVALCLGFHRDAPTPPMRRLLWWGGGALALGVVGGMAAGGGLLAIVLVAVALRVVAYVRGDAVFGRALSLFAVLLLVPIAFVLAGEGLVVGGLVVPTVVLELLLVLGAVLPVRGAVRA